LLHPGDNFEASDLVVGFPFCCLLHLMAVASSHSFSFSFLQRGSEEMLTHQAQMINNSNGSAVTLLSEFSSDLEPNDAKKVATGIKFNKVPCTSVFLCIFSCNNL